MNVITISTDASLSVTVARDGSPLPLSGSVSACVLDRAGSQLLPWRELDSAAAGANWAQGVAVVSFTDTETTDLQPGKALLVVSGPFGRKAFEVAIEAADTVTRSQLFVRDVVVDKIRRDRLMAAAAGAFPKIKVTDDYLWDKLMAAEAEMAHELRVPLAPTHFFPTEPTEAEVQALNGAPWRIDPGYDYAPEDFQFNDKWGTIKLRNKPLHSVSRVRFAYPGGPTAHYDLPLDWLRVDKKYGHIQFVPSSTAFAAPLNAFVMQAIGAGRTIPLAIQISYVAGLDNVAQNYPDLIDAILKLTVVKIIEDAFLPSSGSISADGLSQSISVDMDKYHDSVDRILNGGKGSNGGLMAAIHGIRVGVV